MKMNKWTVGLTALGVVSLASAVRAEEKMNIVQTTLSATTLSGYVDTSAQYNPSSGSGYNAPAYAFNTVPQGAGNYSPYANGFNLDVIGLMLEKPLSEGEWAAGYKVDLWMGPYANQLNTSSTLGTGVNDFCIKQAYVALRVPVGTGINFKMGVFDSIIGYESTASGANPNFTRSYGYTFEPTTFTGLLATYQVCETVAVSGGVADTYGAQINQRVGTASYGAKAPSYLAWMGSVAVTAPESMGFLAGSALYAGIINGFNSSSPAYYGPNNNVLWGTAAQTSGQADQMSLYVGSTVNTPWKSLKAGIAYDYVSVSAQPLTWYTTGYANSIAGYLSWQASEKMSLHGRAEYATHGGPTLPGLPTQVMGLTGTLQYDLWANVLSRLEVRFDRDLSGSNAYAGDAPGIAFASRQNAAMIALNMIYKF